MFAELFVRFSCVMFCRDVQLTVSVGGNALPATALVTQESLSPTFMKIARRHLDPDRQVNHTIHCTVDSVWLQS